MSESLCTCGHPEHGIGLCDRCGHYPFADYVKSQRPSPAPPRRGCLDLLGNRWVETPPGLCDQSIDLDPFSSYDGGLDATCELPAGHTGGHTRTIVWTAEHPDANREGM